MELVYVLRTLWQRKWWVLGTFVLAVTAALYVRHDLAPGGRFGIASQEVLLDTPSSALGDLHPSIDPLAARGSVFARVLTSEPLVDEIARNAHIPARRISVQGPPLVVDGIVDQSTRKQNGPPPTEGGYSIHVLRGEDLPLLSISAQAPTPAEARRLVNGTTGALVRLVDRVQQQSEVPEKRRLTIRELGKVNAGQATDAPATLLALAAFIFVFGLGCLVTLIGPALVAALRTGYPPAGLDADDPRKQVDTDPFAAPAGVSASGSMNGGLAAYAEPEESLDAELDRAYPTDGPSHIVALDPERQPAGASARRMLRRRRDG